MAKRMLAGRLLDVRMREVWRQTRLRRGLMQAVAGLGAFAPVLALANPSGGQVVAGSATIGSAGANGLVIDQSSQRAVINWQQFSIGANQYVQFVQPNSSSVVLNRVIGNNPSSIFGDIRANGQVFLINPNGILFAPGATLDVSSLTASTLDISDSDFMAGHYVFSKDPGAPDATVVNQGNLTVTAGGYVVLAGDYVENDGVIQAQGGKVVLAAGGATTLTLDDSGGLISYTIDAPTLARLAGVVNAGSIVANGGAVVMTADVANALTATAVNNSGLITAHSVSQQGGEILLLSQGGGIENSGTLDASATQSGVAGGTVVIHGDAHTQLTDTSVIDAEGDGAQGGFVELSGHTLGVRGIIKTGKDGMLLIDPASINIVSGGASGHSPNSDSIGTAFIAGQLNADQNVTIVASNKIKNTTGTGITALTGNGNLTMALGSVSGPSCIGGAAACVGTGTPTIGHTPGGGSIDLTGLPINIKGNLVIDAAGNADSGGRITTANLKANSVTLTADVITVNGNITANSGDVILHGHSGNTDVMTVTGTVTADNGAFKASFSNEGGAGIGTVTLHGVTAEGISVLASHINVTGTLHATGSGEAAPSHQNVVLKSQHEFTSAGGASIHVGKLISDHGSVTLSASGNGPSVGNISAGNISAARGVTVFSRGGATGTPLIKVGSITAGSEASINVQFTGNTQPLTVQTGAISAAAIAIKVKGHAAKFTATSLKATGSSSNTASCECVQHHDGFITGLVSGSGHSASFNVAGSVKSMHGNVTITTAGGANSHGGGAITTGNINAGLNVILKGNDIQVGSVTAGSFVSITGESHSAVAHITATGLVKGRGVFVNANGNSTGYGSFGGSIDLAGGVIATGTPGGSVSVGEVGIHIVAKTTSTVKMNITTGALQAAGGSISVIQKGGTGGVTINGAVHASTGGVDIETHGTGSLNGGSISISGSITAAHGVVLDALNPGGAGAKIKVNGSIIAGNINIATSASTGGDITITGGLTASSGGIFVTANSSGGRGGAGGNIKVTGATKASHGSVSFFGRGAGNSGGNIKVGNVTAADAVFISGSFLGTAEAGSVKVQTGNVKGESVFIEATGPAPIIQTGNITATGTVSSAGAHDYVKVLLSPIIATRGKGSISIGTVTGNGDVSIQALGGAVNTAAISAGTDGDVDVSGSTLHVNGAITAIGGSVCLTGSSVASHATKIKVTGTIQAGMVQIKANPGSSALFGASIDVAKVSSSLSGGIMIQAETTANVKTQITTGALNATGIGTHAGHIDVTQQGATGGIVTGNITAAGGSVDITATGSGGISVGKITAHTGVDLSVSGSHAGPIVVTGTITATTGNVSLNDSGNGIHVTGLITATAGNVSLDASGGSISAGAITAGGSVNVTAAHNINVSGAIKANGSVELLTTAGKISAASITAGLDVTLLDQGITGGGITVNGNLTASNTVSIKASNHSGADIKVTGKVLGDFGVTLLADAGTHSGGNIKVTGLTSASVGNVRVTAKGGGESGGNIKLAAVTATGSVSIDGDYVGNSPGFTLQTGKITAEKVIITMTGKDPVMTVAGAKATGVSSAVGFVQLQLNPTGDSGSIDVTGGINTAHGQVDLSGSKGVVNLGTNTITTGGSGIVRIDGGQVHLGSIDAGGGISINAVAVSGHAGSITAGATTLMTGKYVNLDLTDSGGTKGVIAIGAVTATGTTGSSHGGKLSIGANMPTKKVTVSTGALTAVTSINVNINDASGGASLGKLKAPTVIVALANGNLTVGQLVDPGASLTASNGSITNTATGSLDLVNDTFNTAHGVHLKAGTNITLTNDSFGSGGLVASAGGKLVETGTSILDVSGQVLKAKQLVLSATTIELGAAKLTASSIQLSATSINNASGHGSITAAKGSVHATGSLILVGENIIVNGASGPLFSAASVDINAAVVTGTGILSIKTSGDFEASGLHLTAGGLTVDAGQDAVLSGAQMIATKAVNIKAVHDVNFSGATLTLNDATALISAGGSLAFTGATLKGNGAATLHAGTDITLTDATIGVADVTLDAVGGSIDLTGVTADVSGQMTLQAKGDIILSGVHITAGIFDVSASGTIHNGGGPGAITAGGIKVDAKQDIDLSSTDITIGNGLVTGVTGDTALLQGLAALGLEPAGATPNGAFIAGGSLKLGDLDITGDYLVLQGASIAILGKVTAPASGLVVDVRPGDPAAAIGVEGQPGTTQVFNISNQGFFALFPGDTIVVGDDAESGDVFIGTDGAFTLAGGTNLLFDTSGTITGLDKITGSGLVGNLLTVGVSGNNNVVTAGEIDPSTTTTSLGDQTDKKHLGHGGQGTGDEGQNGIIGQDTGNSSVCH